MPVARKNITASRRLSSLANHLVPTNSSLSFSADVSTQRPVVWKAFGGDDSGLEFTDIVYEKAVGEAIAKITINRPERRNAFRPKTLKELSRAFTDARDDLSIGVIILTGKGSEAFCSGGDLVPGKSDDGSAAVPYHIRLLSVTDLQVQIRSLPKPVIAMVAGYVVGGGHELHMLCDLTIAADNAIFGQTGAKVGSFDAGYGCSVLSRSVGPKKAREMWYTARLLSAAEAENMGLVNAVVPLDNLEEETVKWCREILGNSPTAIRVLKLSLNAIE